MRDGPKFDPSRPNHPSDPMESCHGRSLALFPRPLPELAPRPRGGSTWGAGPGGFQGILGGLENGHRASENGHLAQRVPIEIRTGIGKSNFSEEQTTHGHFGLPGRRGMVERKRSKNGR